MRLNRLLFSRRVSVGWEFPGPGPRRAGRDTRGRAMRALGSSLLYWPCRGARRPALRPRSGERTMMCRRCMRRWRRVSLSAGRRGGSASGRARVVAARLWCRQAQCLRACLNPVYTRASNCTSDPSGRGSPLRRLGAAAACFRPSGRARAQRAPARGRAGTLGCSCVHTMR